MNKTNALRLLDNANIKYITKEYIVDESDLSGVHVAQQLNEDPKTIFKTLVTVNDKKEHFVFCIPCDDELDLKKAAKATKSKYIEMVHVKELLNLTGYIRGGCSPVGMKKPFHTIIDETAMLYDCVYFSAGVRGMQMGLNPMELVDFINAELIDVVKS